MSDGEIDLSPLVSIRRRFHKNPELSGFESGTQRFLVDFLSSREPDSIVTDLGGHGIMAVYAGSSPGRTVLLRCDMDALPINEEIQTSWSSTTKGVSHKCGHDGHMVILAGVADDLHRNPPAKGRAVLLFQPAEETGEGAKAILDDPRFHSQSPDLVFALHNLPGYPLGSVVTGMGSFASASTGFSAVLAGRSSHAAQPEKGISPAIALARLILGYEKLSRQSSDSIITTVHASMGSKAFGSSPSDAEILATLRAPTGNQLEKLASSVVSLTDSICTMCNLQTVIDFHEAFPATVNHPEAVSVVERAAERVGLKTIQIEKPFLWSEDFGHFTRMYSGALFGLGAGVDHPPLHSSDYDFPEQLILPGVKLSRKILDLGCIADKDSKSLQSLVS